MWEQRAQLRRVGFEVSVKPFKSFEPSAIRRTAEEIMRQWTALAEVASEVCVLLWTADGSELLEWAEDIDAPVSWGHSVGFSNTEWDPYGGHSVDSRAAVDYRDAVSPVRYKDIRTIVDEVRSAGRRAFGVPVQIGTAFDPGPEFARSAFKYERHPEILAGGDRTPLGRMIRMVAAEGRLDADPRSYAAFPEGIAAGTTLGSFLGRQAQAFCDAMGFDYLWLSNGFGFSSFPWAPIGMAFDGERFDAPAASAARRGLLEFWQELLSSCTLPVEVRGTNFTAGIDIGSDATPAAEILRTGRVRNPAPNSPWGPLNEEFGVELAGYLSRIAQPPGDGFMFRFYANDPWFWQNPWWDFYSRDPFDIQLPLAVSRLDSEGIPRTATDVQILAIDTSSGRLDPRVGPEVGSEILRALESRPDAAGPIVWAYPWQEYHEDLAKDPTTGRHAYAEDWFVIDAIDEGVPLATVISTSDLAGAAGALSGRIVLMPTRALDERGLPIAESLADAGAVVIAYGPSSRACAAFDRLLGLVPAPGIAGRMRTTASIAELSDLAELDHAELLSGGPLDRQLADTGHGNQLLGVKPAGGGEPYPYAVERTLGAGRIVWVRGSSPLAGFETDRHGLRSARRHDRGTTLRPGAVLLGLLAHVGYTVASVRQEPAQPAIVQTIHRHDGAWWFSGYLPDSTVQGAWRFPWGAPVLHQRDCVLKDGVARYTFGRSFHHECRVFVTQAEGRVGVREQPAFPYGVERSFEVTGLEAAEVVVFVPPGQVRRAQVLVDRTPVEPRRDETDGTLTVNATGRLLVTW
jgi:hypothetical protein